jgi:ABC-type phosphate/phosphonate transport system ATPase subunit
MTIAVAVLTVPNTMTRVAAIRVMLGVALGEMIAVVGGYLAGTMTIARVLAVRTVEGPIAISARMNPAVAGTWVVRVAVRVAVNPVVVAIGT